MKSWKKREHVRCVWMLKSTWCSCLVVTLSAVLTVHSSCSGVQSVASASAALSAPPFHEFHQHSSSYNPFLFSICLLDCHCHLLGLVLWSTCPCYSSILWRTLMISAMQLQLQLLLVSETAPYIIGCRLQCFIVVNKQHVK